MVTGMSFAVLMLNGSYKKERNEVTKTIGTGRDSAVKDIDIITIPDISMKDLISLPIDLLIKKSTEGPVKRHTLNTRDLPIAPPPLRSFEYLLTGPFKVVIGSVDYLLNGLWVSERRRFHCLYNE